MRKILLVAAIITIAFTACKKSTTEEPAPIPAPTMVGLWKGNINTSVPLALYLKADNTLNAYNNLDTAAASPTTGKGTGTWSKTNNIINITHKFNTLASITGALTVNDALNNMSGDFFSVGTLFGRTQLNK
jgi:uncharacterized protein (UPF0333 family)